MSRDPSGFDNSIELNALCPKFVYAVKVYLGTTFGYPPYIEFGEQHEGYKLGFKMQHYENKNYYYCHFWNNHGRGKNLGFTDTIEMFFNGDLSSIVMETDDGEEVFNFMSKGRRENIKILFLCVGRKFPHIFSTLGGYFGNMEFYNY